MEAVATWSGWLATAAIALAALVPITQGLRAGRRAPLGSPTIRLHVVIGLATTALAFLHTLAVIPALGSPVAVAGGLLALLPGGAAFFLVVAHAGLGLQLRDPRLRRRAEKRRQHTTTAVLVALTVSAHALLLLRAGR
jgi:hypothetical protein